MRHSAVTFARQLHDRLQAKGSEQDRMPWDVLFCTDMLGLAEFLGMCPEAVRHLPAILYFHENQLTYPNQQNDERDLHFAYSNMTTALAADAVWFNSAYHRDDFLSALRQLLHRMPDFGHEEAVHDIRNKSTVQPPGIELPELLKRDGTRSTRTPGPLRIVWASRWEHDKNPELFFAALGKLSESGVPFEISVLGESFRRSPACFARAREQFSDRIRHWGFAADRCEYFRVLSESDVVVSTARHEFFGISILEAVGAGCRPLVPHALAYPETLGSNSGWFHDGTADGIARELAGIAGLLNARSDSSDTPADGLQGPSIDRYLWDTRTAELDDSVDSICACHQLSSHG